MDKKSKKIEKKIKKIIPSASKSDPLGMYTGVPENKYEQPIQDSDDL